MGPSAVAAAAGLMSKRGAAKPGQSVVPEIEGIEKTRQLLSRKSWRFLDFTRNDRGPRTAEFSVCYRNCC